MTTLNNTINETGMRYGRLSVLRKAVNKGSDHVYWTCLCDCGKEVAVRGSHLRSGETRSCGCYQRDSQTIMLKENAVKRAVQNYKNGAKKRKYEYSLTDKEARKLFFGRCSYCGAKPSKNYRSEVKVTLLINGIDRIDNSKGYIPGNVITACAVCNQMKHRLGVKEFIEHINRIARYNCYGSRLIRLFRKFLWFLH